MTRVQHSIYRTLYTPPEDVEVRVPYSFLGAPYGDEELDAVKRVMESGWLTTGLETHLFEEEWRQAHGVDYAYTASNCTTALHMAAQLCRLEPGDEVVTTPITFVSTNQAVLAQGAVPVFVDVDARTFNIDPAKIREAITPRTKALFVTHVAGQMCDMDEIMAIAREHDLLVVEDCAHTQGASYKGASAGSFGDVGCFSFHAIKNMTTLGEGGMITTNRDDFAVKIPWLRSMGSRYPGDPHDDGTPGPRPYGVDDVDGYIPSNLRMTEAQAAVGRAQLDKLPDFIARRREIAHRFSDALADLPGVTPPYEAPDRVHTYHIYALMIDPELAGRTNHELHRTLLNEYGVHTVPGLYRPSYLFDLYQKRGYRPTSPIAEWSAENSLQLPLYPHLTDEQVDLVISSFRRAMES
ncbi:DegT/DnrJ/EryC1/StrS family aminotransferase [Agromyces aerolatus]|uniref:DegT/DnrJ/EryC1/StrS family aminotransferase n=1 Tax=Agromyces sp. LY-1074 TaxID=3074080 RepID=UPI002861BEDC|nr:MULTISPECIES: DegT/DnrJ/EryC1/StrS family aminotransferase [unclassified Agromyces]MDR5700853.1 DegT/DnrJ/EryC1/StrS family aminotransferase [Agromyces sp. LY-1074]MDR5707486.1 DegT/DnrJ/EryC1/StrS family aminotransferase [Agromyces sp. LY-1358]